MYIRPCLACGELMEGEYDKRVKYHPECRPKCKVEGCGKKILQLSLGLCAKHYQRWTRGRSETNPCKGCGVIIDSKYKWCDKCGKLGQHIRVKSKTGSFACSEVNNNRGCPERKHCNKETGCLFKEKLEKRKVELFGNSKKIRGHMSLTDTYCEPKTVRISEHDMADCF